MLLVSENYPNWHVVFVTEADSIASSSFETNHTFHKVFRHWPGDGSRAMLFVVRSTLSELGMTVCARNRLFSLEMCLLNSGRVSKSLCLIGGHGPHGDLHDWHDFMGDMAWLMGQRERRGAFCCVGDWNVDFGPTHQHYPFEDSQDSENCTMEHRRDILSAFCAANNADLSFAEHVDGLPMNHLWHDACISFPFTRIPLGSQGGRPSLLDFVFASKNLVSSCEGSWNKVPTDHAMMRTSLSLSFERRVHLRSTWVPEHRDDAVCFFKENWPVAFTNSGHYAASDATPARFFEYLCIVRDRFCNRHTASQRRQLRLPFEIRLLAHRLTICSAADRQFWCQRLWSAKAKWFEGLRVARMRKRVDQGRSVSKGKKLHPIRAILSNGVQEGSDSKIVDLLWEQYCSKFGCSNLARREAILDFVRSSETDVPCFDEIDVETCLAHSKAPYRLDRYGVCIELLRVAMEARPSDFVAWLQYVASSERMMSSLESPILCFGKLSRVTPATSVRALIPPCSLLKLLDAVLALLLHHRLSVLLPRLPGCFVGARKFIQPRDIGMGVNLLIEKGLDSKSEAACAQADVARFFDSLPLFAIALWLLARGVEKALLAAILRHQLLTNFIIKRGSFVRNISVRTSGGLTGSSLALTMARVPIESVFASVVYVSYLRGFKAGLGRLVLACGSTLCVCRLE